MKSNVLVVNECAEARVVLAGIVHASGCECRAVGDCATAMRKITVSPPDLVILCGQLASCRSEALVTLERLIANHIAIPVIIAGTPKDDDISRRAMVRVIKSAIAEAQSRRHTIALRTRAA